MTGPKNELPTTEDLCALYSKNPDEALKTLNEFPPLDRLGILIDMANALSEHTLMTQAIEEPEALSVDAEQDPERDYFMGNAFQGRSDILYDATDPTAETVLGDRFQARVRFAAAIGNSASCQITKTQAATNIGNLLLGSERWVEAIDYYQEALKISPKNGVAALAEMDLSRFDAAPLIAFTATKETNYGTETDGRISPRCGAHRADQWAYAQTGC